MALNAMKELKVLTQLNAVSGEEKPVRDYIMEKVKNHADEIKIDNIGNLIVTKKAKGSGVQKRVLLAAHMDEIGLIISGINENGLLSYLPVGGIDARVMVSKRVLVGEKAIPGVIGAKAIHLQTPEDRVRVLKHEDLYIDIGAKDRKSAEKQVTLGDSVALVGAFAQFGDRFVKSKALDDRIGCLLMMRLLEESHPVDLVCAFTVREEVGLHGAKVAANHIDADCALILECTAVNDLGDVDGHMTVANLGQGVAVSFMDNASIAHPGLNRAITKLADDKKIPWQIKRFVSGGNDAGAFHNRRGALPCCVLSVPCRYIHSQLSVAHRDDIESQYALAKTFLEGGAKFDLEG